MFRSSSVVGHIGKYKLACGKGSYWNGIKRDELILMWHKVAGTIVKCTYWASFAPFFKTII
jgi:hypothetical protein